LSNASRFIRQWFLFIGEWISFIGGRFSAESLLI
jgi:hypothetical protein